MLGFVTGEDGFIGKSLSRELTEHGWEGRGLTQDDGTITDLRDGHAVVQAIVEARPDVVFHLAGVSGPMVAPDDPALVSDVNCTGTIHVLEGARAAGVRRVVYASSLSGFDGGDEHDSYPLTVYGATKRFGEMVTAIFGREEGNIGVSARISAVYGPERQTVEVLDRMLLDAREGKISYSPGAFVPLISVRDVASSLFQLATMDNPPLTCDLVTQMLTERSLAELVAAETGVDQANIVAGPRKDEVTLPNWRRAIYPEFLINDRKTEKIPASLRDLIKS